MVHPPAESSCDAGSFVCCRPSREHTPSQCPYRLSSTCSSFLDEAIWASGYQSAAQREPGPSTLLLHYSRSRSAGVPAIWPSGRAICYYSSYQTKGTKVDVEGRARREPRAEGPVRQAAKATAGGRRSHAGGTGREG